MAEIGYTTSLTLQKAANREVRNADTNKKNG
jgi:hypothetical protein